jgi:F0F1-type ATP synthase membrane subunit b/b'
MDTSNVPKTFWHAMSIAILAATVVLVYIALKSTSVSFEIANAKIHLNTAIAETETLNEELRARNAALEEAQAELQAKYDELLASTEAGAPISTDELQQLDPRQLQLDRFSVPEHRFRETEVRLEKAKSALA